MMYEIIFSKQAENDLIQHKKAGKKKLLAKIGSFIKELQHHPTQGTGQVEPLKGYGERSVWSRRIDQKHRLTYEILEDEKRVDILSAYATL